MSVCAPILVFPFTFWLQLRLGNEVSLFPLYMLAIAGLSWEFGIIGGASSVALSTALWLWASVLNDTDYDHAWAIYYNVSVRTLVFVLVAVFIVMFRRVIEQHRQRMEAMRSLLNVCHGCGSVQGSNGVWIPLDKLKSLQNQPLCECPVCRAAAKRGGDTSPGLVVDEDSKGIVTGNYVGPERRKHKRRGDDKADRAES